MLQQENSAIAIIAIVLLSSVSFYVWMNTDEDDGFAALTLEDFGTSSGFTLTDLNEDNITFSDYTGKVRLVTFIYTACTQGCSVITLRMLNMLSTLNQANQNDVEFFVIDFDYMHDNLTTLAHYSETLAGETGIPSNMNFLWGDEDTINQTAEDWEFFFELQSSPMMDMSTDMDLTDTSTGVDMTDTTTNDDMSGHMDHDIVWLHPFVVYLVDQDDYLRKKVWGLDWEQNQVVDLIKQLLP